MVERVKLCRTCRNVEPVGCVSCSRCGLPLVGATVCECCEAVVEDGDEECMGCGWRVARG